MLTVIVILLILNILLNLAVAFLIIVALGEFGASEKFRFELGPVISSNDERYIIDRRQSVTQEESHF